MAQDCNQLAYFNHYMKHTYYVVLAWKLIQDRLVAEGFISKEEFDKITQLIIWHDNSKISREEWLPYARKFYSIGKQSEEVKAEFQKAVAHHKANNLHHFELLQNYTGSDWRCYIIEMVCDYIAMGWEFGVYIFEYYEKERKSIVLPPEYKEYLEQVLNVLRDPSLSAVEEEMTSKREAYLCFK